MRHRPTGCLKTTRRHAETREDLYIDMYREEAEALRILVHELEEQIRLLEAKAESTQLVWRGKRHEQARCGPVLAK